MKNRMQDLDFEQTVAFDRVEDFEFTRKAVQRFRQVVSLEGFEDEDADVIFHYLYKEMELVSFGDHLKRYIYERAGLEEPFAGFHFHENRKRKMETVTSQLQSCLRKAVQNTNGFLFPAYVQNFFRKLHIFLFQKLFFSHNHRCRMSGCDLPHPGNKVFPAELPVCDTQNI